jgi:hypothetical protein
VCEGCFAAWRVRQEAQLLQHDGRPVPIAVASCKAVPKALRQCSGQPSLGQRAQCGCQYLPAVLSTTSMLSEYS